MGGTLHVATSRGDTPVTSLIIADTAWRRVRGLLGRTGLEPGVGLLIRPCGGIHTFGMQFPIDVVFLARDGLVMKVVRNLRPWRLAPGPRGTHAVLEVQSGWLPEDAIRAGDVLRVVPQAGPEKFTTETRRH